MELALALELASHILRKMFLTHRLFTWHAKLYKSNLLERFLITSHLLILSCHDPVTTVGQKMFRPRGPIYCDLAAFNNMNVSSS